MLFSHFVCNRKSIWVRGKEKATGALYWVSLTFFWNSAQALAAQNPLSWVFFINVAANHPVYCASKIVKPKWTFTLFQIFLSQLNQTITCIVECRASMGFPPCWRVPRAIDKLVWFSSWERGKGENWGRAPYGASPGGRRPASQSHSVGRPVLSPLARSGQGGQASGQLESGRPAVAKTLWQESQELRSRGHLGFGIVLAHCRCRIEQIAWTLTNLGVGCELKSWSCKMRGGGLPRGSHLMWPPTCLHLNSATQQQNCTSWKKQFLLFAE